MRHAELRTVETKGQNTGRDLQKDFMTNRTDWGQYTKMVMGIMRVMKSEIRDNGTRDGRRQRTRRPDNM